MHWIGDWTNASHYQGSHVFTNYSIVQLKSGLSDWQKMVTTILLLIDNKIILLLINNKIILLFNFLRRMRSRLF